MASQRTSDLTEVTDPASTDVLPIVSSGVTKKIKVSNLVSDAELTTSDITTNNATDAKHGFCPKLSGNSAQFLNGVGAFASPSGADSTILMASAHSGADTISSGGTRYTYPNRNYLGAADFWNGSESTIGMGMPYTGAFTNLSVVTQSAQHGAGACVVTVRVNGVDSALTCTIPAGSAAGVFSDTTHSVAITAGDKISFKAVNAAGGTSANFTCIAVKYA